LRPLNEQSSLGVNWASDHVFAYCWTRTCHCSHLEGSESTHRIVIVRKLCGRCNVSWKGAWCGEGQKWSIWFSCERAFIILSFIPNPNAF
jgi:hypothetical protein